MGPRWLLSWLRVELAYQCFWRWTRYANLTAAREDPLVRWVDSLGTQVMRRRQDDPSKTRYKAGGM